MHPRDVLVLWQYGRVTGYWRFVRTVTREDADQWLAIFRKDAPDEAFTVAHRRPTKPPKG